MFGISLTGDARAEIEAAEKNWSDFYLQNDATNFDNLLTGDFSYTSPHGEVVNRPTYLENLRAGIVKMDYIRPSDTIIRQYGDAAIVTCQWDVKETYKGKTEESQYRVIRVWVLQDGAWKAASFQVTEIAKSGGAIAA